MFKNISRNVMMLGWVSLFTDIASELLYPVMPLLLRSLGFAFASIGLLEGMAEAVAGIGKIYFGRLSDRHQNKRAFVSVGYGASALSKLGLALWQSTGAVFAFRLGDRVGKGIRTAPRDAILALETTNGNDAAVFGFHRAMDTVGAAIGPLIAAFYLYRHPNDYRTLLWVAAIPGLIAVTLTLLVKEKQVVAVTKKLSLNLLRVLSGNGIESQSFFKAVLPFIVFAAVNSSDVFLLLFAKSRGVSDVALLLMYVWYNLVYALASYPIGLLASRIGTRNVIVIGLLCFALAYGGLLFCFAWWQFALLFFVYGIYAACTESVMKAHVNRFIAPERKAAGMGFLAGWQSLALMVASAWTGLLWQHHFATTAFLISAIGALCVCGWIWSQRRRLDEYRSY